MYYVGYLQDHTRGVHPGIILRRTFIGSVRHSYPYPELLWFCVTFTHTRTRNFSKFCKISHNTRGTGTTSHTRTRPLSRVNTRKIGQIPGYTSGTRHFVKYWGAGTDTDTTFTYSPDPYVTFARLPYNTRNFCEFCVRLPYPHPELS